MQGRDRPRASTAARVFRTRLQVQVGDPSVGCRAEQAIVYIAGDGRGAYTPPMGAQPSEQYLTAIHVQLREHWPAQHAPKAPKTVAWSLRRALLKA